MDDTSDKEQPKEKQELPEWFAEVKRKHKATMKEPDLNLSQYAVSF
tara:strand:- start:423 stop:560 length:138 start_codon:yes stop_codon:yes gene_type:complete